MQTHTLIQGSPEWRAHRATHFNASDAPAMLGCSPYITRAQLLHQLHTGVAQEHDAATERRFADGHRFEALARPLAEKIIGDDLAPVVGSEGELSASFDGLTLMGDAAFEHKSLNDELRACMRDEGNGYALPKHYQVQMEQQLLVSGAERVLFMASKWDGETLIEERHCWYASDPKLRAEIVAGWKQFAADLAAYKPTEAAPTAIAAPIEALPAVSVRMDGALAVHSNLDVFGAKLREFIARIPAKPTSDQEFADCDAACKALKKAEEALDGAEANALGQVQSVETLTRTIADLRAVARTARLASEKMVTARKTQIKTEEVMRGKEALTRHILALNDSLGHAYMPAIPADFAAAVSGKKTIDSLRNAVDTELARAKIAANEAAERVRGNLKLLAGQPAHLFRDDATLVHKDGEAVQAIIAGRLAEEQRRQEAERERIRKEEQERADREAREKLAAEQREAAAAELAAAKAKPEGADLSPAAQALNEQEGAARLAATHRGLATAAAPIVQPAPVSQAVNVVPMGTRAPTAPASQPTMTLGQINDRLGRGKWSEADLTVLGFPPAATRQNTKLYHDADFGRICDAIVAHVRMVQAGDLRAA
jgi:putative phage-type endonuclease